MERFPLEGYAIRVIDGDTIELRKGSEKISVRLAGIDAPETESKHKGGQPGAGLSTAYLISVINSYRSGLQLWIEPGDRTHGRLVGILVVDSLNVNLAMVKRGLVTAYVPGGLKQPGILKGAYTRAETEAFKSGLGLFATSRYRAQYALSRTQGGATANIQLASPERQAGSFRARVRKRALKQADHTQNVYNPIVGMNPGRGDFGGAKTPGNPYTMNILDGMLNSTTVGTALGRDEGMFLEAMEHLKSLASTTGGLQFADIETTGLHASAIITEASYSRITSLGGTHYNWAVLPELATTHQEGNIIAGLGTGYDTAANESVRKALMRGRSGVIRKIPNQGVADLIPGGKVGDTLSFSHIEKMLGASEFATRHKQWEAVSALEKEGRVNTMGGILDFMFQDSPNKRQFMFISNPRFEASKWAAHLSEDKYSGLVTSGRLASGSIGDKETEAYKSVYQQFDEKLSGHSSKAFELERGGKTKAAAVSRKAWYGRLRKLMASGEGKGTAVVDIQDISRSVYGMAGMLDPSLVQGSNTGIMSQDLIGRALGLGGESHLALGDQLQSQVITSRLIKMGDAMQQAIELGDSSSVAKELDVIRNVKKLQGLLGVHTVYEDIANRVGGLSPEEVASYRTTLKGDEVKEFVPKGYHVSGEEAVPPTVKYLDPAKSQDVGVQAYAKQRLLMASPDITASEAELWSKELVDIAAKRGRSGVNTADIFTTVVRSMDDPKAGLLSDPLHRLGVKLGVATATVPLARQYSMLKTVLLSDPDKVKPAVEAAAGKTVKQAFDSVVDSVSQVPTAVSAWYDGLSLKGKRNVKIGGIAAAVTTGLAVIRSITEEERDAQPTTQDIEGYLAEQQAAEAQDFLQKQTDMNSMLSQASYVSNSLIRSGKAPGRYYGSRA